MSKNDPAGTTKPQVMEKIFREARKEEKLKRRITHWDAVWIAAGVPALVLFSIGPLFVMVGTAGVIVWILSVLIGVGMSMIYAELAGMYPGKAGGPPIFSTEAWKHYKWARPWVCPLDIWGYWFAWSPVLAIGALLMGTYIQEAWFPQYSSLSYAFGPITIGFPYIVGALILIGLFWFNHLGIKESARLQLALTILSLVPITALILGAFAEGKVDWNNLFPMVPLNGNWNTWDAIYLMAGGLFVAGWSAYAFETAVCYTAEFTNPSYSTPRSIFYSAVINVFYYCAFPIVLLGVNGMNGINAEPITGGVPALATTVFGSIGGSITILCFLASLLLSINTAVLGSARTLYQASLDGWLPTVFRKATKKGVPTRGMMWDLIFNLALMLFGVPIVILAASTVGYMINNFLDCLAGWLHRRDRPGHPRAWSAPRWGIALGILFAFANLFFLIVGGPVWGTDALILGYGIVGFGVILYLIRRYVQEKGVEVPGTYVERESWWEQIPEQAAKEPQHK